MANAIIQVLRSTQNGGQWVPYSVPLAPGMVVLDALHSIQGHQAPDLAVRWNCKAGKCGSCSAEVNGRPRLTCKTRMDSLPLGEPVTVAPMKSFPVIKDLVTNVAWNYKVNRKIPAFQPRAGVGVFFRDELRRQPAVVQGVGDARRPVGMERLPMVPRMQRRMEMVQQRHGIALDRL